MSLVLLQHSVQVFIRINMKSFLAVALIAGFVAAEVPSNSYLPPPPRGYSSGPAVVTARTVDQSQQPDQSGANGFTRTTQPGQARFNNEQGYDQTSAGLPRNGLEDVNSTVSYEADERGFKPQISYEDSEDLARSSPGYNSNANNFRSSNGYGNEQDGGHSNGYHGNEQNGGRPNARSSAYN